MLIEINTKRIASNKDCQAMQNAKEITLKELNHRLRNKYMHATNAM